MEYFEIWFSGEDEISKHSHSQEDNLTRKNCVGHDI